MKNFLEEVEKTGIEIITPSENGIFVYQGVNYDLPETTDVVKLSTVYKNNTGLIRLSNEHFEAILLKGVYSDFVKVISGEPNISPYRMVKLAEAVLKIEKSFNVPLEIGVFIVSDTRRYVFEIKKINNVEKGIYDRLCYDVSETLSEVEFSLSRSEQANDKLLYGRGMLASCFPNTLSPLCLSIAKSVPELFSPLSMSLNIKSEPPSFPIICGKPYVNVTNIAHICNTVSSSTDYYMLNYAPWIYLKNTKNTLKKPNLKIFNISNKEIIDGLDELDSFTVDKEMLLESGFNETLALSAMTMQLILLKTWAGFSEIYQQLKNIETVLKFVFLTKDKSLLNEKLSMQPYLDPAYDVITSEIKKSFINEDFDTLFSSLPRSKRLFLSKDKLQKSIKELHYCLDLRDKAFKVIFNMSEKFRNAFLLIGQELVDGEVIKDKEDVFSFELTDLKCFYDDAYFDNIPITLWLKKWQNERFAAQVTPYDIYEKDITEISNIMSNYLLKEQKSISCISFGHKDYSGVGQAPLKIGDKLNDIALINNMSPVLLSSLDNAKAVVTDTAPLFSYLTEYCIRTGTPLYSGVRFSGFMCNKKQLRLSKDQIIIEPQA